MRFTTSKNSEKVNQILPILKEHFGNSFNLAHIKFLKRWQIETLIKGMKSYRFDIEKTHLHDTERIARLLALVCIDFTGLISLEFIKIFMLNL